MDSGCVSGLLCGEFINFFLRQTEINYDEKVNKMFFNQFVT